MEMVEEQDDQLPKNEGQVPQSSSTHHNPDPRLDLFLNREAMMTTSEILAKKYGKGLQHLITRSSVVLFLLFVIYRVDLDSKGPCIF